MRIRKIVLLFVLVLLVVGCKGKEFTCEKGELVKDVCKVVEVVDADIKCPTNYEFNAEKGKCVNTMKIAAKTVNTCSKGYVIGNEKWCISEKKYDMIEKRSCVAKNIKEGDTLSSVYVAPNNLCMEKICVEKNEDGTECLNFQEKAIPYTIKKECPQSGMTKWEGYCRKISWLYVDTSCEIGELDGKNCIIENLTDASVSSKEGYKVTEDFKCQKVTYVEPKEK